MLGQLEQQSLLYAWSEPKTAAAKMSPQKKPFVMVKLTPEKHHPKNYKLLQHSWIEEGNNFLPYFPPPFVLGIPNFFYGTEQAELRRENLWLLL